MLSLTFQKASIKLLQTAHLEADGNRQEVALIYRLLLIKLINFEMKLHCLAVNKQVLGDKSDSWKKAVSTHNMR